MDSWFDHALIRFGTSGTLILFYGLADGFARRGGSSEPRPKMPGWVKLSMFASVTAFYVLIGPAGGPLAGGWGNLAGIAFVGIAIAVRLATRGGSRKVRFPETTARMLFYASLPLAVGVPLGWIALTLPAFVASALHARRDDRILAERIGASYRARMATSHRLIPGIW